jgi:RNA polymerase sigma-70 factor (ECF subfamily)
MRRPSHPQLRPVEDVESHQPLSPVPNPDEVLVVRAQRGDGEAWARLYQRHFDVVYRDVLFMVEQAATAEEIVQEAFAAALVSLTRFDGRASVRTWLRRIAQNLVRKHWRSHTRRNRAYARVQRESEPVLHAVGDPEAAHVRDRRAQALTEALTQLPDSLREVFVLRDLQALPVEDVAERLQITPGNVRVRANRARNRIREVLAEQGWLDGGGR